MTLFTPATIQVTCAWCVADAGERFPDNHTSTICEKHMDAELRKLADRKWAKRQAAFTAALQAFDSSVQAAYDTLRTAAEQADVALPELPVQFLNCSAEMEYHHGHV